MSVLPLAITLLACADTVEQDLFDAELDNRDLQLTALSARLDALEATVSAQADVITAQDAALTALGQSLSAEDDVLAARIDAVEARDEAQDEALDGLDGEVAVIGAAVEGLASDAEGVAGELAMLDTRVSEVETTVAGIPRGVDLSAIEADVTDLDTRVTSMESNGRVWTSGGLGTSGTCALVTVDVTEPTTLIVAGTASVTTSTEARLASSYTTTNPYGSATLELTASGAGWSEHASRTVGTSSDRYYDGAFDTTQDVALVETVDLPAAGTYTIRLEATLASLARVSGSTSWGSYVGAGTAALTDCNLIVIDP